MLSRVAKVKASTWWPCLLALTNASLFCVGCGGVPAVQRKSSPDIYALGDLHGDFWCTLATLYGAGVVDKDGNWAAGKGVLVQVGDLLDRGGDGRCLIDYLRVCVSPPCGCVRAFMLNDVSLVISIA